MPKFWQKTKGGHSVTIVGYNNRQKLLEFANSWGKEWGNEGFGYLPYKYVDKFLIESWIASSEIAKQGKRGLLKNIGEFEYEFIVFHLDKMRKEDLNVIDVYKEDKRVGWVQSYLEYNGARVIVEDLFVMLDYRGKGIGRQLVNLVEQAAKASLVKEIIYYIHIQDLLSENGISTIENLFRNEDGYKIEPYKKAFKGCVYKIYKKV